tara:strand:+ start:5278 stop:6174 length:897 start_codon:yes stop_codon:yes gene_type:complete
VPELSIALDSTSKRCLVLSVPQNTLVKFSGSQRDNISIDTLGDETAFYIVMKLEDRFFDDLFDDLIISIFDSISDIGDPNIQARTLIQTFHKWSEFFTAGGTNRLSRDQVQGLIGELKVLETLTHDLPSITIDDLLRSWRGPYDNSADFVLEDRNIEVKTILAGKSAVTISSEYQLSVEQGKGLELTVIDVELNPQNGVSLSMQVETLKTTVYKRLGDFTIILDALRKKGVDAGNIADYDNFRFVFLSKRNYNAAHTDFPKLDQSNTPSALHAIKYSIRLPLISEYLVEQHDYNEERI